MCYSWHFIKGSPLINHILIHMVVNGSSYILQSWKGQRNWHEKESHFWMKTGFWGCCSAPDTGYRKLHLLLAVLIPWLPPPNM